MAAHDQPPTTHSVAIHSPSTPPDDNDMRSSASKVYPSTTTDDDMIEYPLPIPVAMRSPFIIGTVKQYRSESQQKQLQQHIVSESFIPVAPDTAKTPRRRRRPPFSYSSLIAQAILGAENERMTLRDIYQWIMKKYPALYDANDTGWQNTIRHNLSLNKCFKKIPKCDLEGINIPGKGGYWTVDAAYLQKFKNGSFMRGTSAESMSRRKKPRGQRLKSGSGDSDDEHEDSTSHQQPQPVLSNSKPTDSTSSLSDDGEGPKAPTASPPSYTTSSSRTALSLHDLCNASSGPDVTPAPAPSPKSYTITSPCSTCLPSSPSLSPYPGPCHCHLRTTLSLQNIHQPPVSPTIATSSRVMQIHNLLN